MKSPIVNIFRFFSFDRNNVFSLFLAVVCVFVPSVASAQVTSVNPGEIMAVTVGNSAINSTIKKQIKDEEKQNALMLPMSGTMTIMSNWEEKYNNYLKSVDGIASTLTSTTQLFAEGIKLFHVLTDLTKAVTNNPQGVVATVSMNNLYMETLTELLTVYPTLKDVVSKGGAQNMLNAVERCKILYDLEDKLHRFNIKLHQLYLSIRHYVLLDVWNTRVAALRPRNTRNIADESYSHWKRAAKEVWLYR